MGSRSGAGRQHLQQHAGCPALIACFDTSCHDTCCLSFPPCRPSADSSDPSRYPFKHHTEVQVILAEEQSKFRAFLDSRGLTNVPIIVSEYAWQVRKGRKQEARIRKNMEGLAD